MEATHYTDTQELMNGMEERQDASIDYSMQEGAEAFSDLATLSSTATLNAPTTQVLRRSQI
ncbi:hypothetical protein PHMEG_0009442 [Phytophthora megakarya]|uniref:Uncharacterized protein n=1 Tax=Phytophthora megakarya TaxID=4795 RepID=A0A225WHL1_9STRA|nr:hypothetical protein PHMEG_0009442 [Phytophthora megakarya]